MGLKVSAEWAPAYELVLSMASAGRRPDLARLAGPRLMGRLNALGAGSEMFWAHLLSAAVEAEAPRDGPALLRRLDELDGVELRLRLAGYYVRWFRRQTPPDVIAAALGGDAAAGKRLLATSEPSDPAWQSALRHLLALSPGETKRQVRSLVESWDQHVAPALLAEAPALESEADRRCGEAQQVEPGVLIATVARGYEYVPEPGIERILLIPSAVIAPDLHVFTHQQLRLICYPFSSPAGDVPPPPELAALAVALGDERRLRLARLLAAEPQTARQLADRLGVPITTVMHHLELLKRAGVVGGGGRGRPYVLVPWIADRLSALLETYLGTSR